MKRLLILLTSSSLLLASCAPTVKSERKRNMYKTAGEEQNAERPGEITPIDDVPPSIEPVDDTVTPVDDVPNEPVEQPAAPAKPTPPPPAWNNGVSGPIAQALNAAIKGVGSDKYISVYGHKWKITKASITRDGDRIVVEGAFQRSSYGGLISALNDKVTYEFVYSEGKIERNDIYTEDSPSPLMILGPIASIVGAFYGVPIPPNAVNQVAGQIESIVVGNWQGAAQKLSFRIAMAAYLEALAKSGN